ncbi:MAG: hypothetical protein ACOVQ0_04795, partial [Novosphingobium sp.]|uniref:hypothetical protein n=1 Tax=Novosphingobium sp. TaxID=1874826 RepID=UPI003B9A461E
STSAGLIDRVTLLRAFMATVPLEFQCADPGGNPLASRRTKRAFVANPHQSQANCGFLER